MKRQRVVITGMGAITPIGVTADEIAHSLKNSVSGVKAIELFDASPLPVRFAGQALGFKAEEHLDPKEIRRNDRFIQMCLAASDIAVKDAGLTKEQLASAGVAIGVGLGGLQTIEESNIDLQKSESKKTSPFLIPSILANLASGQVSIRFETRGPNYAVCSACASGSQAIGQAFRDIQEGRRDFWLAGGAEAPITPLAIAGFASARALSRKNETPAQASRPFDQARDGFVIGEGAATFVLESLSSAEKRGAKIYAEILGFGIASDGFHVTEPEPNGEGAYLAMKEALAESEIKVSEIDYVNAHATSTPVGDQVEAVALERILGEHSSKTFVSSTKSLTGHACGAAGALETAFCLSMIDRGYLAPTYNMDKPSEEFKFKAPLSSDVHLQPKIVMNNSFGFGGINTSLIFRKFTR